jgi:hypothetical protein
MTNEEMLVSAAVSSWKISIGRLSKGIAARDEAQLQQQVAPGKNRLFYLVGHLTAVHDRMFPLTAAFEALTPQEWLQKHTQVSDEDFAKDPSRNRFAVFLSRTNHASFHTGQLALVK